MLPRLLENMTPRERGEVETFAAFVIARRKLQGYRILSVSTCPASGGLPFSESDDNIFGESGRAGQERSQGAMALEESQYGLPSAC